eukprot:4261227-Pleurochrysis_carterae.AAC.1
MKCTWGGRQRAGQKPENKGSGEGCTPGAFVFVTIHLVRDDRDDVHAVFARAIAINVVRNFVRALEHEVVDAPLLDL